MVGFNQPAGSYTVVAKLSKHLSRRIDNLSLSGNHTHNWSFTTLGDLNNDDRIDDADLLIVLFAFGSSSSESDVNGDGIVDDADLLIILFNFGAVGEGAQ
jgi:endo-1,4-beta-mannosidase